MLIHEHQVLIRMNKIYRNVKAVSANITFLGHALKNINNAENRDILRLRNA